MSRRVSDGRGMAWRRAAKQTHLFHGLQLGVGPVLAGGAFLAHVAEAGTATFRSAGVAIGVLVREPDPSL